MTIQPLSGRMILIYRVLRYGGTIVLAAFVIAALIAANRSSRVEWLRKATTPELLAESKLNPNDEELNLVLERHLKEDGKLEQAYDLMVRLVKEFPNSARCWDHYATAAAETSRVLDALKGYQRETQIDPTQGSAFATMGTIYIKAGLYTDGLAEIDKVKHLSSRAPVNVELWVQALEAKGRYQEAWDHIIETIQISPMQDAIYPIMGRVAQEANKVDEAESLMQKRIDFSPMYDVAYVRGPLAHLMVTNPHDPQTFDEALHIATLGAHYQISDAQLSLAEILVLKKDLKGARAVLEKGLKMDVALGLKTKNADCLRMLASIADAEGNTADAKRYRAELPSIVPEPTPLINSRAAAKAAPDNVIAQLTYARDLEQFGAYGQAAEVCAGVLAKNPNDSGAAQMMARCRDEALHKLDSTERAAYAADIAQKASVK
jgi:tetratricopeptide (TPR) repeat protein